MHSYVVCFGEAVSRSTKVPFVQLSPSQPLAAQHTEALKRQFQPRGEPFAFRPS